MRLIPVPLFYANDPKQAIEMAVQIHVQLMDRGKS